jgi:hypothetical protein
MPVNECDGWIIGRRPIIRKWAAQATLVTLLALCLLLTGCCGCFTADTNRQCPTVFEPIIASN